MVTLFAGVGRLEFEESTTEVHVVKREGDAVAPVAPVLVADAELAALAYVPLLHWPVSVN